MSTIGTKYWEPISAIYFSKCARYYVGARDKRTKESNTILSRNTKMRKSKKFFTTEVSMGGSWGFWESSDALFLTWVVVS